MIEVRPLVVVREHQGGFFSAFSAFSPRQVAYGGDRERALDELRLYLTELFKSLSADEVQKFLLPEPAEVRHVPVRLRRGDLSRREQPKTPISLAVVEVRANNGRWVLIPALESATFVAEAQAAELDELVAREIERIVGARSLRGAEYLDLLPPDGFELERLNVELESEDDGPAAQAAATKRHKAALTLLAQIGRTPAAPAAPVVGRDVEALAVLLNAPERPSVVLVGPEGSGKSALMQAALRDLGPTRRVYATSGAELVAGQSFLGQLEQRVEQVMNAAELSDATLYFESFDDLFAGRPGGHEDLVGSIQRYIEGDRVRIVGEVTPEQYDRLSQRYVGFFSRVLRFAVPPLDRTQTLRALEARAQAAERTGRPFVIAGALPLLVDSVERYDPYRALPGKAVAFFDALSAARAAAPSTDGSRTLGEDDIYIGLSLLTGMPPFLLRDERALGLDEVEQFLHRRVVGQHQAVRRVAETLCSVKAGLQPSGKPLATFLFVGPTGVGKTELAKALARFLFGSETRMARFDMSEYMDRFAAERLIRGTDRADGVLTRRAREHLFGVLLLDEIEKADPAVFDLLLQVLGEGRLSDARGRTAYFSNFIVIMTSNVGTRRSRSAPGFGTNGGDDASYYDEQVRQHFRPEFVNRLDRVVRFESLTRAEIAHVAERTLERIALREGLGQNNVRVVTSPAALATLAEGGYSSLYGARGLRRHLERSCVSELATLSARLGARLENGVIAILGDDESKSAVDIARELAGTEIGEELGRGARSGVVFVAFRRPRKSADRDAGGMRAVSALRRRAHEFLALEPITELRERWHELEAQLSDVSSVRRKAKDRVLAEMTEECGKIRALLEPIAAAAAQLDEIEWLSLLALQDGQSTSVLEPEANASFAHLKQLLVPALYARSDEHEIALVLHELDQKRALQRVLLPLLELARTRGFVVRLHLDRGERKPEDQWPEEKVLRWGPPRSEQWYLERYEPADAERPFTGVVLCVKGHGAGALLALAAGRYVHHQTDGAAEVLIRVGARRFALGTEEWRGNAFDPNLDRGIARRADLRFELAEDARIRGRARGPSVLHEPYDLFRRWEEHCFDAIVATFSDEEA